MGHNTKSAIDWIERYTIPHCDHCDCRDTDRCDAGYCTCEAEAMKMAIEALKFKDYFDDLYGQGLEIANWNLNGDLEPFDNFYDAALE